MNIQYISKKSEEAKERRSRTYWRVASRDHDLATHQHAQAGSQQKEKENNSETQARHFIKEKYLQRVQVP
jgi:hypothetical protein